MVFATSWSRASATRSRSSAARARSPGIRVTLYSILQRYHSVDLAGAAGNAGALQALLFLLDCIQLQKHPAPWLYDNHIVILDLHDFVADGKGRMRSWNSAC